MAAKMLRAEGSDYSVTKLFFAAWAGDREVTKDREAASKREM
jgi:hypothetical protein